jgi:antirestriction protein
MIKIFLGKELAPASGKWLTLPMDRGQLLAEMQRVCKNGGEWLISDWESDVDGLPVGETSHPMELNALAERLSELDEGDLPRIGHLLGNGFDIDDAFEKYEDVQFYPGMRLKDVAAELVDEGCFGEIPKTIANYIDYEAIGRDLRHDGYEETNEGVFAYHG